MSAYLLDWAGFLGRWFHLIAGIAWIGSSFYFVWLDSHLRPPKDRPSQDIGIGGEVWSVHGGGFYRAQKFRVAPPELPEPLHWFKWEAYSTWLSGMFLLALIYYVGAEVYLIDRGVAELSRPAAIGIGLAFLAGGWIVYDLLCRSPLGRHEPAIAAVLLVLLAAAAWALCQLFSGRGAYIHFGALIGTIMVANVAMVIIPGQRAMVEAKRAGRAPDPAHGLRGKQRSVHNTYFTLPVLFVMISNHYALFTNHRHNWAILVAISVAGALIRLYFVQRHRGTPRPWLLGAGAAILALLVFLLRPHAGGPAAGAVAPVAPVAGAAGGAGVAAAAADASGAGLAAPAGGSATPSGFARVQAIVQERCAVCHAARPTYPGFAAAPMNVLLDTPERIVAQAASVHQQTVVLKAMPIGNLTRITDDERAAIDAWWRAGARRD